MRRHEAKQVAQQTVDAFERGNYVTPSGATVDLTRVMQEARSRTVTYLPGDTLPAVPVGQYTTQFRVKNETTLDAAIHAVSLGQRPVALNFASANNPGGGFLNGAIAQEEALCRASGLYWTIKNSAMYRAPHGERGFYSDAAIYSPDVPVIASDTGEHYEEPYRCSFVTCAAVNAGIIGEHVEKRQQKIAAAMRKRVDVVLRIMAGHGHETIILGAWGCGVFRNDPTMIAELFQEALTTKFHGVFAHVHFAVVGREESNLEPFSERFG